MVILSCIAYHKWNEGYNLAFCGGSLIEAEAAFKLLNIESRKHLVTDFVPFL